jgi:hypothetical protein
MGIAAIAGHAGMTAAFAVALVVLMGRRAVRHHALMANS